jgi:mRNA interferase RelE/StbE
MNKIRLSKKAAKALDLLPDKQFCQLYNAITDLHTDPRPVDSIKLGGKGEIVYYRKDVGEYRIVYHFDTVTLFITLADKRNDKVVYKKFERF